jgi:hypothetical protein
MQSGAPFGGHGMSAAAGDAMDCDTQPSRTKRIAEFRAVGIGCLLATRTLSDE